MAAIQLFNYQQEALATVQREYARGTRKQLIVLPMGTGKTIVMAAIAKHFNKKTLLIAHREELIQQAKRKIKLYWPKSDIGICKAEHNEIDRQIVVGSVLTCCRPKRLSQLKKQGFEILMIDEAHHASADTYQKIINELGFGQDTKKFLVGVTATPERNDNKGLLNTFDKVVFLRSIPTMIKAGYLPPIHGRKILTDFSLKSIKTHRGDFAVGELSNAINTPERNAFVVDKYLEHAAGRKSVAFCVDVKHTHDLTTAFQKKGITAAAVWGAMPTDQRKKVLNNLRKGVITVVVSCGVLTEGFDEESLTCVIMARPTKSKVLYTQAIGRGIRPWPNKENCLVLDFADKYHNLDSIASLSSTIPNLPIQSHQKEELSIVDNPRSPYTTGQIVEISDEIFDLFGLKQFTWINIGNDEWSLADDFNNDIVLRPSGDGYIAKLYFADGGVEPVVVTPLPLNYCVGVCEDFARRKLVMSYAENNGSFQQNSKMIPASPKQIEILKKNGIPCHDLNKADAALAIREVMALKRKYWRKKTFDLAVLPSYIKNNPRNPKL